MGFLLRICLVITMSLTLLWEPSFAQPQEPLPIPVGRVVWIKGELRAIMPHQEERILKKSSVIYLHDTLVTNAESQAQIVFTDNTLMTFKPNTKFYIDQYSYRPQPKGKSVGKFIMRLIEGGFRTITGLIAENNPTDYVVNTPVATIGVRGTDYAAYYSNGEILMAFYSGIPCVTNAQGTLCLDRNTPFARVTKDQPPEGLTERPAVFDETLPIEPAEIGLFTDTTTPSAGTTSTPTEGRSGDRRTPDRAPTGPVNSFCITQ